MHGLGLFVSRKQNQHRKVYVPNRPRVDGMDERMRSAMTQKDRDTAMVKRVLLMMMTEDVFGRKLQFKMRCLCYKASACVHVVSLLFVFCDIQRNIFFVFVDPHKIETSPIGSCAEEGVFSNCFLFGTCFHSERIRMPSELVLLSNVFQSQPFPFSCSSLVLVRMHSDESGHVVLAQHGI